jgi:chitodextrinase
MSGATPSGVARPGTARRVAAAAAAMLACLFALAALSRPAAAATLTRTPVADSYVDASTAGTNFGTSTQLRADTSPDVRAYLRFDVPALSGSVTSAALRIWANSAHAGGYRVGAVASNTWVETTINANNAPPVSTPTVGPSGALTAGAWSQADVTALVQGSGLVSLGVVSTNTTAMSLASRESGAHAPQLVIVTGVADQGPPTAPGNVSAAPTGPTQVAVSWSPSTDDVGVTGYRVFRGPSLVGSPAGTSFSDAGLTPDTDYTYTVRAVDAAGNQSADSLTVQTHTPADGAPPSAPANVAATADDATQVTVTWTASTDDVAVTGYEVLRAGGVVGSVTGTTFTESSLAPDTDYSYTVRALDAAGNTSAESAPAAVHTPPPPDVQAPTPPTTVGAVATGPTTVAVSWEGAGDDVGVVGYRVFRDGSLVDTPSGTAFSDVGLTPATAYDYTVRAVDAAGNPSSPSSPASVTTDPDASAPSAPANVTATVNGPTQVTVAWAASGDDVGVTEYRVFRDGSLAGTVTTTSFIDPGLTPSTTYAYTVMAADGAGNASNPSSPAATATTPAASSLQTIPFPAVADSYVDASQSTKNFGTAVSLRVDGSPLVRSYLRFNPQGLSGGVARAVLRIWANSALQPGYQVGGVASTTWAETTINGGNAPPISSAGAVPSGPVSAGTWNEMDVTGLVTGPGPVNLGLSTTNATALNLASRESGAHAPQLLVTTGGGGPDGSAPTTPGNVQAIALGAQQIRVTWSASTDDAGVAVYRIFRNGSEVGTVDGATTAFVDSGLAAGTQYAYGVEAVDAAGNASATSAPVTATTGTGIATCAGLAGPPATYGHVIWIWMENKAYSAVIGSSSAPYINSLAQQCGSATNYNQVTNPSLPNYIAATSGSTQGVTDDNAPSSHPLNVPNLFLQVQTAGKEWRSYAESAPANCTLTNSGNYLVRHDPVTYYTNVRDRCATWDVPLGSPSAGALVSAIQAGTLPAYTSIAPNACNDMHGGGGCPSNLVKTGDDWLAALLPKILNGPNYRSGETVVFLVWDEASTGSPRVPALVMSPYTMPGVQPGTRFDHYSLLRTTEELLGLPLLGQAASAPSMRAAFGL